MRITGLLVVMAVAAASPGVAESGATLPDELVLTGDNIIDVTINGQALRLEVRPEAADAPTLNPDVAARLALKPGMFGFVSQVGSEKVNGSSAVHKVDYGAGAKNQRIFWASRPSSTLADGTISPASLPYKQIRFVLAAPLQRDTAYSLPLDNFGFLGRLGVGTTLDLDGEKVRFQFSLQRDETLVSAPTGNWLAQQRDGKFTGQPQQTLVYFGIKRPTREMTLARPVPVGPMQLAKVDVRYADYGDASGIAAQDGNGGDSDEIVVVGDKQKNRDLRIVAGRRFLQGCSSLVYDMQQRRMTLNCQSR